MKKTLIGGLLLATVFSVNAYAIPATYEALVTEASYYEKTLALGATLDFDYWFVMGITPPPYAGGGFDVLVSQAPGGWEFLGQVDSYFDSPGWLSASLAVPVSLQGTTRIIRFSVVDYGPETDPSVYLDHVGGASVPEPSTLLLLGGGLLALVGYGRRMA